MTPEELYQVAHKEQARQQKFTNRVLVCSSTGCIACNSEGTREALKGALNDGDLKDEVEVVNTGCMGLCALGPLVMLEKENALYKKVGEPLAREIVDRHLVAGEVVDDNLLDQQDPFFASQTKIVLEHCGKIDAERIEEYIAVGGYTALAKAITEMQPEEIIDEVRKSGLRGRGGAGYPTGLKWDVSRKSVGEQKYVICNGDEGDPGAYMDRNLLESDPHRILEGMAIAAYAVGANQGYIYTRAEYPLAIKRLKIAIRQAERLGLLGHRIFESQFNFRIDLRIGAGAFVCGEETALLRSIQGRRGRPRPRPPYPSEKGLFGAPTVINNVETLANIPSIVTKGGGWFAGIGTPGSTGTKIFALTGKVKHTGLIEVPMGMPLREIIFDIGGGTSDDKDFKAAQTGGPSGGCISKKHLDLPVDYESLKAVGSMMGSGGMIVMDSDSDMVDVAKFFMEFCVDESCGKCTPCRVGTKHLYLLLDKISAGQASAEDITLLEELCMMVKETSLCGLGQSAPNPVLSTLRFFREEYEKRLKPLEGYEASDLDSGVPMREK
ncbi:MAG: NADH-quinone oxidoreductase subunit NuoF [Actinobacteria bacterium]|nr:NADH-quinone oxidoreductase subunit NuoF [Actinomycetota bacterium]MCL5888152.1 NADH-quinone oxidoreductase subunit NuoF [Actinomycetota bacterium]